MMPIMPWSAIPRPRPPWRWRCSTSSARHREARCLADDVEQRHLHGGLGLGMADHGMIGIMHQLFDAKRIGADEHRTEIDVESGGVGLDRAGEDGPRCGIAPA